MPIRIGENLFYVIEDVVELLNKSTNTVRRYCREGRFPEAVKRGREWIIPSKSVADYLTADDKEKTKKWIAKKYR